MKFAVPIALTTLSVSLLVGAVLTAPPVPTTFSFELGYPQNKLSSNQTFEAWGTENFTLPVTNWPLRTNISGLQTNFDWTVPISGSVFFAMSVSNIYGRVFFSNIVSIPSAPDSNAVVSILGARR